MKDFEQLQKKVLLDSLSEVAYISAIVPFIVLYMALVYLGNGIDGLLCTSFFWAPLLFIYVLLLGSKYFEYRNTIRKLKDIYARR